MINFESELIRSPKFYAPFITRKLNEKYLTEDFDGYSLHRGEYWCSYQYHDTVITSQGWKIHISASPTNLDQVLERSLKIIRDNKLHFKVVNTRDSYFLANSKNAARETAGKLITIYPDENDFEVVASLLAKELKGLTGPEILTDLPGSVSCLHFRYGAFVPMINKEGEYCLLNKKGQLVPDRREILVPTNFPKSDIPTIEAAVSRLKYNNSVDISEVKLIKQSNAGGIFRCNYQGQDSFLKIGRKFAGLDKDLKDGATRVLHEAEQLKQLSGSGLAPELLLQTSLNRDVILIAGDLGCLDLHQFKKAYFPLYAKNAAEWEEYLTSVLKISSRLENRIHELHSKSIYHRDLHGRNILTDGAEVYFVDFEEATNTPDDLPGFSKAQGFANKLIQNAEEADWYAFRQIIQELVFGNTRVNQFNIAGWDRRWDDPYQSMRCSIRINELLNQLRNLALVENRLKDQALFPHKATKRMLTTSIEDIKEKIRLNAISCINETGKISVSPDRRLDSFGYCLGFEYIKKELNADWDLSKVVPNFSDYAFNLIPLKGKAIHKKLQDLYNQETPLPRNVWESEELQLLILERITKKEPHFFGVIQEWIMRLATEIGNIDFRKPINVNSNLPSDQCTGLLYGPLGIAWAMSLWVDKIPDVDKPIVLDAICYAIQRELDNYKENNKSALFAVQGNRLLPYISTGSAGFGLVLPRLKQFFPQGWMQKEAEKLLRAVDTEFSICSGLSNGMTGLVIGVAGISNFLNRPFSIPQLIQRIRRLLPHDDVGDLFLDDSSIRYVFDIHEGAGGFLLLPTLLKFANNGDNDALSL
ncbi:hypothetical protein EML15_07995 [Corynebacterium sp. sy017]|uniref:class III lanthionine synthetase LanKC N-terminal domain-containing protein n=1 Tax=unclassified Corynebacterium TaxID=2624378 RepID=UPI001184925C|nr:MULTISPECIES: phosphotransferase [unclassified Corynebacterium]MBP3089084.1 hypothetical protein [Corynebacterium sp. sy017]TSD91399.1 hypothetical protein ELY17_08005 [Corynebacterium sp. SY003]